MTVCRNLPKFDQIKKQMERHFISAFAVAVYFVTVTALQMMSHIFCCNFRFGQIVQLAQLFSLLLTKPTLKATYLRGMRMPNT
jgi:hypothetical protein